VSETDKRNELGAHKIKGEKGKIKSSASKKEDNKKGEIVKHDAKVGKSKESTTKSQAKESETKKVAGEKGKNKGIAGKSEIIKQKEGKTREGGGGKGKQKDVKETHQKGSSNSGDSFTSVGKKGKNDKTENSKSKGRNEAAVKKKEEDNSHKHTNNVSSGKDKRVNKKQNNTSMGKGKKATKAELRSDTKTIPQSRVAPKDEIEEEEEEEEGKEGEKEEVDVAEEEEEDNEKERLKGREESDDAEDELPKTTAADAPSFRKHGGGGDENFASERPTSLRQAAAPDSRVYPDYVPTVEQVVHLLRSERALDLVVVNLQGQVNYTNYFIIASGRSDRHNTTMAQLILSRYKNVLIEAGLPARVEGAGTPWVAVDMGSIVVHLFNTASRHYFALDKRSALLSDNEKLRDAEEEEYFANVDEEDKKRVRKGKVR